MSSAEVRDRIRLDNCSFRSTGHVYLLGIHDDTSQHVVLPTAKTASRLDFTPAPRPHGGEEVTAMGESYRSRTVVRFFNSTLPRITGESERLSRNLEALVKVLRTAHGPDDTSRRVLDTPKSAPKARPFDPPRDQTVNRKRAGTRFCGIDVGL